MAEYVKEVMDKSGAADYLGLSEATIMRRAKEGVIGRRLGKKWRFTISELRDYANGKLTVAATSRGGENGQLQAGQS